jgi:ABC-type multidrug transport system ATPase subunit
MQVRLENLGKKYNKEWIFRGISLKIECNSNLAILGPNGSGKSTLLRIISSWSEATEGTISYSAANGEPLEENMAVQEIGFVAPYLNIIEEFTLKEHLDFHFTFKKPALPLDEMVKRANLEKAWNKSIVNFSSGMRQRLKLLLGLFTNNHLILMDEPTSNLDEEGISWYREEVQNLLGKKTIIIASNQRSEYDFIEHSIDLNLYKYKKNQ